MRELLSCAMDIGEQMLISGAEVHRVEDSMSRICTALGAVRVDCFIITSSMVITVHSADDRAYTETRRIKSVGTDFDRLDKLNSLSRRICNNGMTYDEIQNEISKIKRGKAYPFLLQCAAYAVIAAAFTAFFGGELAQILVSGVVGAVICFVVALAERTIQNMIFSKFVSSLFVTFLSYAFLWIGAVSRVDEIIIGNIMLIIPGLGFTNALRDLFTGDSIAGALRSLEAAISALSIAAGYILFAIISGEVSVSGHSGSALIPLQVVGAFLGSLGFAVLFNIRGRKLVATAVGGGLGWILFLLLNSFINDEAICYFIVAMSIALYSEIMSRILKAPATIFIAPSLIPLVPGASLYYTMAFALRGNTDMFSLRAFATVSLSAALAIGIIVSAIATQLILKFVHTLRMGRK